VPSRCSFGEGLCRHRCLELIDVELPGVAEDGMSGKNGQRKPGTARGSPRRSRTAKASRISRHAAKSRCAREWGGWGRLSDDGSGHDNPNRSEGSWGMWRHLMAARNRARRDRLRAVPMMRSRGARRTDANQAMASVCREQAQTGRRDGKAPSERPAFQPYWGKLTVRNDRGDRGNVGIIRSPVRASILPDRSR
jgi:hypothetical protein